MAKRRTLPLKQSSKSQFYLFSRKTLRHTALRDVTADTVGMLVPGGSIAVKLVKVVVDQQMTEPNKKLGK
jgi:hypothetical protein